MQEVTIIKVGGKVVENETSLEKLLIDFSGIKGLKILIHGGGNIATELANKLGLEVEMVNGRRVTDKEMLDVVTMVYGGLINKKIVAGLQSHGINAIGLTGADLNLIQAEKRPVKSVDYGFVGDIKRVNLESIKILLANNIVPVIAPLTHDGKGQLFNTNADDITNAVAESIAEIFQVKLVFCFDRKGVMLDQNDEKSIIPALDEETFAKYVQSGIINSGMIPKLENGFKALNHGVNKIYITDIDSFYKQEPDGTTLIKK